MPAAANLVFRRTSRPHLSFLVVQNYSHSVSEEIVAAESKSAEPSSIKKKEQKFPFAKNLFVGKFDYDVLTYPEVLDKERLQTLKEMVAPIERFFADGDSFYTTLYLMTTLSYCHTTASSNGSNWKHFQA
jgi:acyl-CoA dehydrogenase family protein 9